MHDALDVGLSNLEVALVAGHDGGEWDAHLSVAAKSRHDDADTAVKSGANDIGHGGPSHALGEARAGRAGAGIGCRFSAIHHFAAKVSDGLCDHGLEGVGVHLSLGIDAHDVVNADGFGVLENLFCTGSANGQGRDYHLLPLCA